MTWQRLLAILMAAALAAPAQAGLIFGKKKAAPVDPAQRVPELLGLVKSAPDEGKRAEAASELRKYDTQAFADIVPVLIDVLANDPKASVRLEAAQSLGRLRPISQAAGQALEQALANDPSLRVRLQCRTSLLHCFWSGYRSPKKDAPPPQTKEPPLAPPGPEGPPLFPPAATSPPPGAVPPPPSGWTGPPLPPVVVTTPGAPPRDGSVPVIRLTPKPGPPRPLPVGPTEGPTLPPRDRR